MDPNSFDKLNQLIEKRERRGELVGGEILAVWGVLNLITVSIYKYLWHTSFPWLIMVVLGIVIHVSYLAYLKRRSKYKLFWEGTVNYIWLVTVILLPVVFFLFPVVFKLYGARAVFPLVELLLAVALFISGIISRKLSMKVGGVFFLGASLFTAAYPGEYLIPYMFSMIFGFIVPGIWSRYERKKLG